MRILLVGYYGKANFGDDVLFKVTYGVVKERYPDADIVVLCDRYKEDYLHRLVGGALQIVEPGNREQYDLIVHGGGGTFFDFQHYGVLDRTIYRMMKLLGFKNVVKMENILRRSVGRPRISAYKRLGFGIGVGTYTEGSKKIRHHMATLLEFDTLVVRDKQSIENLKLLGITDNVLLGSDLAFMYEYWMPLTINNSPGNTKKKIGLVLRDWKSKKGFSYLENIKEILSDLDEIYDLTIFVFDQREDHEVLCLSDGYKTIVWNPETINFDAFCSQISIQDCLVTSRAHGAICGVVLGVPSVIIELEPKLKMVHEFLSLSTTLINVENIVCDINYHIEKIMKCPKDDIRLEVISNRKSIERYLSKLNGIKR